MANLLGRLRTAFDNALDNLVARAIGEPRDLPLPHLESGMIIAQDDKTLTVYTAFHVSAFAEYIPALIRLLQNAHFEDAPHLLDYATPLADSAATLVIEENPPGNFVLDKNTVIRLRELAEMVQPYQVDLCTLSGIVDAAQMLCQNFHYKSEPSAGKHHKGANYLPNKDYN